MDAAPGREGLMDAVRNDRASGHVRRQERTCQERTCQERTCQERTCQARWPWLSVVI